MNSEGGGHNFGSNNEGWATKIKTLFLGGGSRKLYILILKSYQPTPLLNNERSLSNLSKHYRRAISTLPYPGGVILKTFVLDSGFGTYAMLTAMVISR